MWWYTIEILLIELLTYYPIVTNATSAWLWLWHWYRSYLLMSRTCVVDELCVVQLVIQVKTRIVPKFINQFTPSAAYMRQRNGPSLVQVMTCRLFGAKPLSGPMLPYCKWASYKQISVKFAPEFCHFHSRNYILKISSVKMVAILSRGGGLMMHQCIIKLYQSAPNLPLLHYQCMVLNHMIIAVVYQLRGINIWWFW